MRAENNAWWLLLKNKADRSATPSYSGGDIGEYAVLAYQITGDVTYARKAWTMLNGYATGKSFLDPTFFPEDGRNFTREAFVDFVWMYDWLYPALSASERTLFLNQLNRWGDMVLDKLPNVSWGTRLTDSDETVGHYFGLAFLDLATGPDNPRAGTFLSTTWNEHSANATLPVGGLTATASNLTSSMRNAIRCYVEMAEGGEWLESSEYNMNTMRLLLWGAYGVRTATGVDYFPEISRYAGQLAKAQISEVAPDLNDAYQWGDDQEPRTLGIWLRLTLAGSLSGLLQNDASTGPYAQEFVDDLVARYPEALGASSSVGTSFFLCYNPYASRADWRGAFRKGYTATGYGFQFFHDGWGVGDSFFGTQFPTSPRVDHGLWYLNTFQLYRRGEWAVTHPIGYQTSEGEYMNSMLIGGLSATYEHKGLVAQEYGPADEYAYSAGSCSGQFYEQPYYEPPATFLHEWTRSLLYLPSADKHSDTIVIFDRTNADNPKNVARVERYRASDLARIQGAPSNKQWIIHSPVVPTLTADAISWSTAGGQRVRVNTLLPAAQNRTVVDEKTAWTVNGTILDEERKFQTRITPQSEQRWDTFLNVVQAYDAGTSLSNTTVRSTGGEAEGAVVARGGHNDTLVLFSANTFERVLTTGYTLNWTANTPRTEAYFLDLAPAATWSVVVDGGVSVPVTVSEQGVGRVALTGVGPHTLRLAATAIQDTTAPAVPSGLTANAGEASIAVSWNVNTEKDLAGYYLLRSDSQAGTYVKQSSAPLSGVSLTQTGLQNGTPYWYRVCAVDQSGNESPVSAPVSATPVAALYSVSGTVTESGAPVANATVTIGNLTTTTSSTGSYSVGGLTSGTYTVSAVATGYTVSAARYVTLGPSATNVNFTAEATGAAGLKVDTGGNGYTSATAGKWLPDSYVTGGDRYTYTPRTIAGTSDPALYTSVRYGKAFTYQFPVPAGSYVVKLHFTECWSTTTGRIFNVYLNGTQVLSRFDIVGAVGPNTLVVKSFPATSNGSGIIVAFQDVQNDALVNAIEVLPVTNSTHSISGKVTSGTSGLGGVTISAGSQSAMTAADGTYSISGLAAGTHTVSASKTDYTLSAARTVTVGPDQTGVDFTATPNTFGVSGVVRVNGTGLPGATVSLGSQSVTTAADGSYTFSGIASGTYTVSAAASEHTVSAPQSVTVGPSKTGVDFTAVRKTYIVRGTITSAGVPLAGVTVTAGTTAAATGADGTYTLGGLIAGSYSVQAALPEFTFSTAQTVTVGPDRTGVDFTAIRNTYTVSGSVTVQGAPLAGVTVTAGSKTGTTATDGTYTLTGLLSGTYSVTAAATEYTLSSPVSVTLGPSRSAVNFTAVRKTYSVRGAITAAGNPLAGATVTAGTISATTAADGTYVLAGLVAGTYTVQSSLSEYTFNGAQSVTVGPDRTGVNFTAARNTYSVSGAVTAQGSPVSGVTVTAGSKSVSTAADGTYVLTGLISGTYTVEAVAAEYTLSSPVNVTLGPSRTGVNFTAIRKTYSVRGTITAAGNPLAGVTVTTGATNATSAADGTYTLAGLVAGTYMVQATLPEYTFSVPQSVTIGPDRTGIDFTATRNTYTVSGTVTVQGAPLAGVTVTAGSTSGSTAADGTYTLIGLLSGTYSVTAAAAEYTLSSPVSVTLGPSRSAVNFTAVRKTYSIGGTVTVGGVGLAGVTVSTGARSAITGSTGAFLLDGLVSGTYSVSAAKPEYTFSAAQSLSVGPSRTGIAFTGTQVTYQVSGKVWDGSNGLSGVTVTAGSHTATTGADGTYTITGLVAGNYTVGASRKKFAFSTSQNVTLGPSRSGVDFSRVAVRSAATFQLQSGRAVADGSALDLELAANGSTITAAAFDLVYDPALVSFASATAGVLPAGVSIQAREQEAGRARVVLFGTGTTAWASGKVATVTFRAAAGAPAQVSAPVAVRLPDSGTDGVQVSDEEGFSADASAKGSTVSFTVGARGDLNRNGSIDVGDIQLLLNVLLGAVRFDAVQHDLNDNGSMDVGDIQSLVNLFLNGGQPAASASKSTKKAKAGKPVGFRLAFNPGKESVTSLAFDLDLNGGTLASIVSTLQRGDLQLAHRTLANGRERVLLYSSNGTAIPVARKLFAVTVIGSNKLNVLRPNSSAAGGDGARADGTMVAVSVTAVK